MSDPVKKIENNTARVIQLLPTENWPRGIKLIPGLNSVPMLYWDEFLALEVPNAQVPGVKSKGAPTRFPGKLQIEMLQVPCKIVTPDRTMFGPQITVYEPEQAPDRPDGPPPPVSLKDVPEEAAKAFVKVTTDRKVLKRWADERSKFSDLCKAKLAGEAV